MLAPLLVLLWSNQVGSPILTLLLQLLATKSEAVNDGRDSHRRMNTARQEVTLFE